MAARSSTRSALWPTTTSATSSGLIRESKNIDAWKSIMQAVDADYRWIEFSTTPEAHVGLWVRR